MSNVRVLVSDKLAEAGLKVLREAPGVELDFRPGMSEDDLCAVTRHEVELAMAGPGVELEDLVALRREVAGRQGLGTAPCGLPTRLLRLPVHDSEDGAGIGR